MKKLLVLATLLVLSTASVKAETLRTCSSVYGGGEVCGETTTETKVTHDIIATRTGANDNQMIKLALSIAGAALTATVLYKMTYKNYFLG
jgi:hypothetical protein